MKVEMHKKGGETAMPEHDGHGRRREAGMVVADV